VGKVLVTNNLVFIRGGGDLGSGVAHRLFVAGFSVVVLELEQPMVIRRSVAFASAVYEGEITIEGVTGRLVDSVSAVKQVLTESSIPVLVDPDGWSSAALQPAAVVDARLAKRNLGTRMTDAAVVIGLGPGFQAGADVHAVIETQRGHDLGRVIWHGPAAPNTGVPGRISSEDERRLLRAPVAGIFYAARRIGDMVTADEIVAHVDDSPVITALSGLLRGIIHDGVRVQAGEKVGDIDPRSVVAHCFTISDKARAVAGGVLEALLHLGIRP
jgi:xanthine dehydrogenase accessory factor